MKKVIRLTESDLTRIVKRVIMEQETEIKNFEGRINSEISSCLTKPKNFKIPNSCYKPNTNQKQYVDYKQFSKCVSDLKNMDPGIYSTEHRELLKCLQKTFEKVQKPKGNLPG